MKNGPLTVERHYQLDSWRHGNFPKPKSYLQQQQISLTEFGQKDQKEMSLENNKQLSFVFNSCQVLCNNIEMYGAANM